jgi:azurin
MAVLVSPIRQGTYSAEFTVSWSADADTDAVVTHGLSAAPNQVIITPTDPKAYVGTLILGAITSTQVTITKANAVGSGGATCRLQLQFIHSIQR